MKQIKTKKEVLYQHTQKGWLIWMALFFVSILFAGVLVFIAFDVIVFLFMLCIIILLLSFATVQVTITQDFLHLKFGYGIFKKRFSLKDIVLVKKVKNKWYYGWGIRFWFAPRMWIYNISGFDAIEIILKNKKRYRIGSDEPKRLQEALQKEILRISRVKHFSKKKETFKKKEVRNE